MTYKTLLSIKLSIMAATLTLFSSCTNNAGVGNLDSNPGSNPNSNPDALNTSSLSGGYPVAKPMVDPKTGEPVKDHYISPYRPYNPIVAKYFKSGQLAGDPSTMKVDPKTGKPDKSTIKAFRIP